MSFDRRELAFGRGTLESEDPASFEGGLEGPPVQPCLWKFGRLLLFLERVNLSLQMTSEQIHCTNSLQNTPEAAQVGPPGPEASRDPLARGSKAIWKRRSRLPVQTPGSGG